ncbi:MAG TPA: NADH-quinone oxidoreductase subunit NuoH [Acidimicrobiales bacterium]
MFAADPLLGGHIGLAVVLIVILKTVLTFVVLLVGTMFMVWFERKVVGDLQNRIGPNRAGPFGLLQTLADGIKVFFKEDLIPDKSDRFVFKYAPLLSMVPAFITFAVVPIAGDFRKGHGGVVKIFGHQTLLQLADPPIGILLVLAMSSIAVYGVMLAGWSSGSKYPLLGSVRASAQMVSYEAALGLSVVAVVLVSGTLSTSGIVALQRPWPWNWNLVVTGIVPFVVFLIAGTAELNRPPFDLVEAEQELVGGYQTEYSGIRFALFYLAEFMNTITMSAIIVTLFLGGPNGPVIIGPAWIWGLIWFLIKLLVFLFIFVWFRATLPRFRYDQLMDLGWKALIPLSLGWLLLLTAVRVGSDQGWNPFLVVGVGAVVLVAAYGLLATAMRVAKKNQMFSEVPD